MEVLRRKGIDGWDVALWTSLAVGYCYLIPVVWVTLIIPSFGPDPLDPSFSDFGHWHWLSISLVVAAVLHYFWFRRLDRARGRYQTIVDLIGIHLMGFIGALGLLLIVGVIGAMIVLSNLELRLDGG